MKAYFFVAFMAIFAMLTVAVKLDYQTALEYNPNLETLDDESLKDLFLAITTDEVFDPYFAEELSYEFTEIEDGFDNYNYPELYDEEEESEYMLQNDSGSTGGTYVVKSGDMLSKIAPRFGCTVNQLVSINNIKDANKIYVGQVLRLCGGSPAPSPSPSPAPSPSPQPSNKLDALRKQVVDFTLSRIGKTPYVFGGNSLTAGTDCSGLMQLAYRQFGINISRTTYTQIRDGRAVGSLRDVLPGDLVVYDGHVAMAITRMNGNGKVPIVHARSPQLGTGRSEDAAYRKVTGIRRIIN